MNQETQRFIGNLCFTLQAIKKNLIQMGKTQAERNYLEVLKKEVEGVYGTMMQRPKHFVECSKLITDVTHKSVSNSTLKRIYGYVPAGNNYTPSTFILNTLSEFVGYGNFREFCKHCKITEQKQEETNVKEIAKSTAMHLECATKGLHQLCNILGINIIRNKGGVRYSLRNNS